MDSSWGFFCFFWLLVLGFVLAGAYAFCLDLWRWDLCIYKKTINMNLISSFKIFNLNTLFSLFEMDWETQTFFSIRACHSFVQCKATQFQTYKISKVMD